MTTRAILPSVILLFRTLFCSVDDCFGRMTPAGPRTFHGPISDEMLRDHLLGRERYGIAFVDAQDQATLLCIDVDEDLPSLVTGILTAIHGYGLVAYVERSKSRGYHVWIFFQERVPARHLKALGRRITTQAGYPRVEVFPKQDVRGDTGNWVFLPLHGVSIDEGRTAFVDPDNGFVAYDDQHEFLASIRRNSLEGLAFAEGVIEKSETEHKPSSESPLRSADSNAGERTLTRGERNTSLTSLAGTMRRRGMSPRAIEAALLAENRAICDPPLTDREVRGIAHSVSRYKPARPVTRSSSLPVLYSDDRDFHAVTTRTWDAIAQTNCPERLFIFGGIPVRLELGDGGIPVFRPLDVEALRYEASLAANWRSREGKGKKAHPPLSVVRGLTAFPVERIPLPCLTRLVTAPYFAPDGALHASEGFNPQSKMLLSLNGRTFPELPSVPNDRDVLQAKALLLDEVLSDFPFVSESDRAHALALILLPFVRPMIHGATPLTLVEGPSPGTGKGLLVRACMALGIGHPVGAIADPKNEEELRKALTSQFLAGRSVIFLDNLTCRIDSGHLASALTESVWEDRALGTNRALSLPIQCIWVATANNPAMSTEMARRIVRVRLVPRVSCPWARNEFRHDDLLSYINNTHGQLVHACLVLIRSWIVAGRPLPRIRHHGSFDAWARVLGGILEHVGVPGFLGNVDRVFEEADQDGLILRTLVALWWERFQGQPVGTRELLPIATKIDGLDLGDGTDQAKRTRFGKMLSSYRDRIVDSIAVRRGRVSHNTSTWYLEQLP